MQGSSILQRQIGLELASIIRGWRFDDLKLLGICKGEEGSQICPTDAHQLSTPFQPRILLRSQPQIDATPAFLDRMFQHLPAL
jgi:hypothetical protein